MKKAFTVCIIVGVLGCGGDQDGPQPRPADTQTEVASFLESYDLALTTRDVALLRTLYAEDGRFEWIEDGEIRYRSPDDILAGLAALPSDAAIRTEYEGRTITPVGAVGARVSTRFVTVIGEGPTAFEFSGMITMVLEKGPAGWRIVGGHTSSERQDGR